MSDVSRIKKRIEDAKTAVSPINRAKDVQRRNDEKIMNAIIELHGDNLDSHILISDVSRGTGINTATISLACARMSTSHEPYCGYYLDMSPTGRSNPRHRLKIVPAGAVA